LVVSTTNILKALINPSIASLLEMSVSPNLLKERVQDSTTTDRWLVLDAWKKLLYNKYNFGDGLDLGISKLKKSLYLYGKRQMRSIMIVLVVLVVADDIFLLFNGMGCYL
jgi:hypothetical protein